MEAETVTPKEGPQLDLPLSQGVKFGQFVFVSGQVAFDKEGNLVGAGDIARQAEQTLKNLQNVLEAAGSSLEKVLKVNVYLKDVNDYQEMNKVYRTFSGTGFRRGPVFKQLLPATSC